MIKDLLPLHCNSFNSYEILVFNIDCGHRPDQRMR